MAVVGYFSCYGYTKAMAEAIAKGVESKGIKASLVDLDKTHKTEAIDLIHEADGLAVGSSTINRDVLHPFFSIFRTFSGDSQHREYFKRQRLIDAGTCGIHV